MAKKSIVSLLTEVKTAGASDLLLTYGAAPQIRLYGFLQALNHDPLTREEIQRLIDELISERQRILLETYKSLDFSKNIEGVAKFRFNVFFQRGYLALAGRIIPDQIPLRTELGIPLIVEDFADHSSGLVLITGPAEAAGLLADGIWFLGVEESSWPARAYPHPLLPASVQRSAQMPHSSAALDMDAARAATERILRSAAEVHFSYARQNADGEKRPARLAVEFAAKPVPLADPVPRKKQELPVLDSFADRTLVPFPPGPLHGGAAVLSHQSRCPFRAFATARLDANSAEHAQPWLTPAQRGSLLHHVLHTIWSGPPEGLRSRDDLLLVPDLRAFVADHVRRVFAQKLKPSQRAQLSARYLELEEERLVVLLCEWLGVEAGRVEFTVEATEQKRTVQVGPLSMNLRLDRLDRLNDDSVLIVDYKTGKVSPSNWDPPRPRDVQLPLYAGFALDRTTEPLGGLVFAQIVPGEKKDFFGRVFDAVGKLQSDLGQRCGLVKDPLDLPMLEGWRQMIESLAEDFARGKAAVDPADYPKTCKNCGLESICRIREKQVAFSDEEEAGEEEQTND